MRNILFILLIGIFTLACSNDNYFDPTAIKPDGFRGITYTDTTGNIIGPIDKSDWRGYGGHSQYLYMAKLNSSQKVIPISFAIRPAYPNPFTDSISIAFALPIAMNIDIVIINEDQHIVYKINEYSEAGYATINWDGLDNNGQKYPDGLYRVIYDISDWNLYGFGDIWLQSNPL